ncbi:MAG: peptidylprolyl isomerase [Pseudomonadota bacterium]
MRRTTLIPILTLLGALAGALAGAPVAVAPSPAIAQEGGFAPVITVNGLAITGYELEQRTRFIDVLGGTGDLAPLAETALIEDRLREDAARKAGISVAPETLRAGMEEFASRANLTVDKFVEAIGQGGVDAETFRDFVKAGLLWREVVRQRFRGAVDIVPAQIDRALSVTERRGAGPRVLVSEIVIPIRAGNTFAAGKTATDLSAALKQGASFAESARRYSAAPSRDAGGQIGWIPLSNLPPGLQQAVASLQPGQISEPLQVPGGIAIVQLRGIEQGSPEVQLARVRLDYLTLSLPQADAARMTAEVSTCADFYAFARSYPADRLSRQVQPAGAVPADIAGALAAMDENEMTVLSRQGQAVAVMLCGRTATAADGSAPPSVAPPAADGSAFAEDAPPRVDASLGFAAGPPREGVRTELVNAQLARLADQYLAQLKANAVIVRAP